MTLDDKIEKAIKIMKMIASNTNEVELSYSGGKDSDVILELAKMAKIPYVPIYKKTTIDPPGTIAHVKEKGVRILEPKQTFFQLVAKKGLPTRRARFCCSELKEYKVMDNAIQGIRRCESAKRKKMYSSKEPIICRIYGSKANHVNVALPILDWSDDDVAEFIKMQNIQCHSLYYKNGVFDVTERLGCMGCPLASDNGLSDFVKYPKLVPLWLKAADKFLKNHPNCGSNKKFESVYDLFVHNIFYDSYRSFVDAKYGIFETMDCKKLLENYFKISL